MLRALSPFFVEAPEPERWQPTLKILEHLVNEVKSQWS
jgi:hypothetical protein